MVECLIHHVALNAFGECPDCKAEQKTEQKRHQELIASQTRLLEAQEEAAREQGELQQRIIEAQEQAEWERHLEAERLEEIQREKLEIQRTALEEQRQRQREEEAKRRLRVGLLEFSPEFQQEWISVAKRSATMAKARDEQRAELASLQSTVREEEKALAKAEEVCNGSTKARFEALLAAQTLESACWSSTMGQASALVGQANATLAKLIQRPRLAVHFAKHNLFESSNPVVTPGEVLCGLAATSEYLPTIRPSGGSYLGLACVLGLLASALVSSPYFSPSGALGAGASLLFLLPILAFALPIVRWIGVVEVRQKHLVSDFDSYISSLYSLANAAFGQVVDRTFKGRFAENTVLVPMCDKLIHTCAWLDQSLRAALWQEYGDPGRALTPEMKVVRDAARSLERAGISLRDREEVFQKGEGERREVESLFRHMAAEIDRVGSEVLDGLRVPGQRQVQLVRCSACHRPASSESSECPYCGWATG
jgi:hypothetical protein